jgi:hypothetical protein
VEDGRAFLVARPADTTWSSSRCPTPDAGQYVRRICGSSRSSSRSRHSVSALASER